MFIYKFVLSVIFILLSLEVLLQQCYCIELNSGFIQLDFNFRR